MSMDLPISQTSNLIVLSGSRFRFAAIRESKARLQEHLVYLSKHLAEAFGGELGANESNAYAQLVAATGELVTLEYETDRLELSEEETSFTNLDTCIAFHDATRWRSVTVAIARSGYFPDDVNARDWVARLDAIEAQLSTFPETLDVEPRDDASANEAAAQ